LSDVEKMISLAVSLLTLLVVVRLLAAVFGGGSRTAWASQAEGSNQQAADPEVDQDEEPGSPGRWNSSLERNRYYRARGHDANGME
jgi:hypothetical protein